jgi:hypothetical protein
MKMFERLVKRKELMTIFMGEEERMRTMTTVFTGICKTKHQNKNVQTDLPRVAHLQVSGPVVLERLDTLSRRGASGRAAEASVWSILGN